MIRALFALSFVTSLLISVEIAPNASAASSLCSQINSRAKTDQPEDGAKLISYLEDYAAKIPQGTDVQKAVSQYCASARDLIVVYKQFTIVEKITDISDKSMSSIKTVLTSARSANVTLSGNAFSPLSWSVSGSISETNIQELSDHYEKVWRQCFKQVRNPINSEQKKELSLSLEQLSHDYDRVIRVLAPHVEAQSGYKEKAHRIMGLVTKSLVTFDTVIRVNAVTKLGDMVLSGICKPEAREAQRPEVLTFDDRPPYKYLHCCPVRNMRS